MEIFGLALGLVAGPWFQFMLLLLFLHRLPELSKSFIPLRSTLLYLIASGGMSIFTWQFGRQGLWEQGPFLLQNWTVFVVLLVGSALIYLILLLLFKEEQAVRIALKLKSRMKDRQKD